MTAGLPLGRRPDRMVQNIVTGVKKVETMLLKSNRSPSSTSVLPTAMGGEAARPAQWEVTAARPGALRAATADSQFSHLGSFPDVYRSVPCFHSVLHLLRVFLRNVNDRLFLLELIC